jgi:hypothetical protein
MQRRIFRLYGELRFLEGDLSRCKDQDERARIVIEIKDLERRVFELKLPRAFSEMAFNLRTHIRNLRESATRPA